MKPEKQIRDYEFFQRLTEIPCVEAIHIFGSRARETYRPESDLDLAIFCPDATDADWATGRGPTVAGPAQELLLVLCGRARVARDLTGPGVPVLSAL